jgi:hypothetical protein
MTYLVKLLHKLRPIEVANPQESQYA